jgi:3-deoxy-D-manno-octulosonic-acid transferase
MRLMVRLLLPLVPWAMLAIAFWRWVLGREPRFALAQRLGFVPRPDAGGAVWLHAASNGEMASARWVLEDLLAARPAGLQVLVTTNTATAQAMGAGWGMAGVTVAFAPLDLGPALHRVLQRWKPQALITVEGEIYPRRFALCAAAHIPIALIGARMSERSFRGWQALQPVMARALARVNMASVQDAASGQRLLALGLPLAAVRAPCDLKAVAIARLAAPSLPPQESRARWLLAASTHAAEEAIILDAFAQVRSVFDHLIIAPRHPRRADEVAALIAARGLGMARRSSGGMPETEPVFLADTMGEMDLWYARCGVCVVGGSFVHKGGHTPWEPVRMGCAVVHGPWVDNFAAPYATLAAAGGALQAQGAGDLAQALASMNGEAQARQTSAAVHILSGLGNGAQLFHEILTLLSPEPAKISLHQGENVAERKQ